MLNPYADTTVKIVEIRAKNFFIIYEYLYSETNIMYKAFSRRSIYGF